ncbi:hypothetical protein [Pyrofollis japonicus]|nr:hypothetical protein [Pyrofollis japonicus]
MSCHTLRVRLMEEDLFPAILCKRTMIAREKIKTSVLLVANSS